MRLQLLPVSKAHKDLASSVSWNVSNDLYTCSDDQSLHRWNAQGESEGKVTTKQNLLPRQMLCHASVCQACLPLLLLLQVCVLDTCFSEIHCSPLSCKKQQAAGTDLIALACTDGEPATRRYALASFITWQPVRPDSICCCLLLSGTLKLVGSNARVEKSVDAHRGAVLSVKWCPDGERGCCSLKQQASSSACRVCSATACRNRLCVVPDSCK
jgi:intraflagellar transport protein 80